MIPDSSALGGSRRAISPEWALAILALLTFALIPIQINTIYGGLPAHPLFLHVPVILIPVAAIAALVLFILFTAVLLIAIAVWRTGGPRVSGVGFVDSGLQAVRGSMAIAAALRVVVAVLAVASLYYVFHTGDLGAKAVWQHRVGGSGFPGGGSLHGGPPPGGG